MSIVKNDSESLRVFISDFQSVRQNIVDEVTQLSSSLMRLGETWQDQQYQRMAEKLNAFSLEINRFYEHSDAVPAQLEALASKIDERNSIN